MKLRSGRRHLRLGLRAVAVLAMASAVVVAVTGSEERSGDPTRFESRTAPVPFQDPTTSSIDVEHSDTGSAVFAPNRSSRIEDVVVRDTVTPVSVSIPAIGIDAPVVSAGVDKETGQMEVPRSVSDVGWYQHGPSPGEPGSAVLAAHVDLASQGRGVFFDLRLLEPGDRIMVRYDDGGTTWFTVAARRTYDKEDLPLEAIFSRTGEPVLTLVTCGGGFDASSSRYDSNVVVYAVPVTAPGQAPPN
ncbi:MAG: class F sortase [Acidimicrobiia bacterium]|nr:class F sortase [Acidimicrobiia bacterium]